MSAEASPDRKNQDPLEFFPNPEDWDALQGGRPRVFRNPHRPNSRWIVLHVYDEHGSADKRFRNGAIVDTLPPDSSAIPVSRLIIRRRDEDANLVEREIIIPSMMHMEVHGDPCEDRSNRAQLTAEGYKRVRNQEEYVRFIDGLRQLGMGELRYGIQDNTVKLIPMPEIRPPRPLEL